VNSSLLQSDDSFSYATFDIKEKSALVVTELSVIGVRADYYRAADFQSKHFAP
jgi:hypothetical protein